MAAFSRCLSYISEAGERQDRDAMLLGGHLADALHSVPDFLCRYNCDSWYSAERFATSLRNFHEVPEWHGAPIEVLEASRRLLNPELLPGELGLLPGLSNLDLAPRDKLCTYLGLLYSACLSIRYVRNCGLPAEPVEAPLCFWNTSDEGWLRAGDQFGTLNGILAAILLPIPSALVNWNRFDEIGFRGKAERLWVSRFGIEHWARHGKWLLQSIDSPGD